MLTDRLKQSREICVLVVAHSAGFKIQKPEIRKSFDCFGCFGIEKSYQDKNLEIVICEDFLILRRHPSIREHFLVENTVEEAVQNGDEVEYNLDMGWIKIYRWFKTHVD